ncbi:MAG: DUF3604 domain-containing protein [Bacteroidetes bacterium]|nr:DUF3604 domain-containing protein [Bacteroidota bacterium]
MPVTQPHVRLHESTAPAAQASSWRDFLALTKPEITFLVAITTVAGFLLAPVALWQASVFWAALVGTVLTSAGACVLNHVAEYRLDAAMKRTAGRPLPSGRVDVDHAFYMGSIPAMADPTTELSKHEIADGMTDLSTAEKRFNQFQRILDFLSTDRRDELLDAGVFRDAWEEIKASANRHNDPGQQGFHRHLQRQSCTSRRSA